MSQTTDLTDDSDGGAQPDGTAGGDTGPSDVPALLGRVPRLGVWAWSFVGFVVAADHRGHRPRRGQRDRAPDDVRGRSGRVLQAAGRSPPAPQGSSPAWPPAWSSSVCSP